MDQPCLSSTVSQRMVMVVVSLPPALSLWTRGSTAGRSSVHEFVARYANLKWPCLLRAGHVMRMYQVVTLAGLRRLEQDT